MDESTIKIIFLIGVIITIVMIDMIPINYATKEEIDDSLPSCKDCKKTLNDFCSPKYCDTPNCKIDPRCKKEIQYSCSHPDFMCNQNTCRDFDKYKNDKSWGCYGMF